MTMFPSMPRKRILQTTVCLILLQVSAVYIWMFRVRTRQGRYNFKSDGNDSYIHTNSVVAQMEQNRLYHFQDAIILDNVTKTTTPDGRPLSITPSSTESGPSSLYLRTEQRYLDKKGVVAVSGINVSGTGVPGFSRKIKGSNLILYDEIIRKFSELCDTNKIEYFMYSGTLLGSYRHHGYIPWDDDVDFVMKESDKKNIFRVFSLAKPKYSINVNQNIRWKFFSSSSKPIMYVSWSWPFIDISFYLENNTHIWDLDAMYPKYTYEKTDVFPLTTRPFQNFTLPAPRNTREVLRKTYDLDSCDTGKYNHRLEMRINHGRRHVNCTQLYNSMPFVHRISIPGGVNESLVEHGTVISWKFIRD